MNKGQLIGEGNTAEVYAWGDNEVLKLFRKEFYLEGIEKEYSISKKINESGLPNPKVDKLIEVDGRMGIVYERIQGKSMLNSITMMPWSVGKDAKRLAEMHYRIHQCKLYGLPKQKEAMEKSINYTELLPDEIKQDIIKVLKRLPEGEVLCHGDYHPGNIIVHSDKEIVLDWMTATSGNAAADVARTLHILKDASLPNGMPFMIKILAKILRSRLTSLYLKHYRRLSGLSLEEIELWRLPIAAARLIEWVPEDEKKFLLKLIEKKLKAKNLKTMTL